MGSLSVPLIFVIKRNLFADVDFSFYFLHYFEVFRICQGWVFSQSGARRYEASGYTAPYKRNKA